MWCRERRWNGMRGTGREGAGAVEGKAQSGGALWRGRTTLRPVLGKGCAATAHAMKTKQN